MKINSAIPAIGTAPDTGRARSPAATAPHPEAAASERVDISSLSTHLQGISTGGAPINAQRVADIKQAISEGRFQINPERIADGLLASVRDMLGRSEQAAD